MSSGLVVLLSPNIQIGLKLLKRRVQLLAKGNSVNLFLNGPVKALANTIGLRMIRLGAAVVDVFHR